MEAKPKSHNKMQARKLDPREISDYLNTNTRIKLHLHHRHRQIFSRITSQHDDKVSPLLATQPATASIPFQNNINTNPHPLRSNSISISISPYLHAYIPSVPSPPYPPPLSLLTIPNPQTLIPQTRPLSGTSSPIID